MLLLIREEIERLFTEGVITTTKHHLCAPVARENVERLVIFVHEIFRQSHAPRARPSA